MNTNETTHAKAVSSTDLLGNLVMGGRFRCMNAIIGLSNVRDWILVAADLKKDRFRLVPENRTIRVEWESTLQDFNDTFIPSPNAQDEPQRKGASNAN